METAGSQSLDNAVPLTAPADGVPAVTDSPGGLHEVIERFAAGHGPVAVDAERASGYRYSQRAYLVQLRRAGAGTALIDPVACPDLSELGQAIAGTEWVLHAASQDLACLREVGLAPTSLFDTELAARLLGYPRVGLAYVVADTLGLGLAKEHSAADWSTRPLPQNWLVYAALDVEVLIEVRDILAAQLATAGKQEWAAQEFAAEIQAPPPAAKVDPWRRTSGIHTIRDTRGLAVVRALWYARDDVARTRDMAPGRLLPDSAIVLAATTQPTTRSELLELRPFATPGRRRYIDAWLTAIRSALQLPASQLPRAKRDTEGSLPPQRIWTHRFPDAAARLSRARVAMSQLSQEHTIPAENLLPAIALRSVCFAPPHPLDAQSLAQDLQAHGARAWQVNLATPALLESLQQ